MADLSFAHLALIDLARDAIKECFKHFDSQLTLGIIEVVVGCTGQTTLIASSRGTLLHFQSTDFRPSLLVSSDRSSHREHAFFYCPLHDESFDINGTSLADAVKTVNGLL